MSNTKMSNNQHRHCDIMKNLFEIKELSWSTSKHNVRKTSSKEKLEIFVDTLIIHQIVSGKLINSHKIKIVALSQSNFGDYGLVNLRANYSDTESQKNQGRRTIGWMVLYIQNLTRKSYDFSDFL